MQMQGWMRVMSGRVSIEEGAKVSHIRVSFSIFGVV
jgi:hypothetical protein